MSHWPENVADGLIVVYADSFHAVYSPTGSASALTIIHNYGGPMTTLMSASAEPAHQMAFTFSSQCLSI